MRQPWKALACALTVAACRTESRPAADTTARKAVVAPVGAEQGTAAPTGLRGAPQDACRKWGDWQVCSVEDRLTRAGLVFERDPKPVHHDFLSVPGVRYTVHKAEVQVFVYPSATARAADTDALDTLTVSPRGRRIIWPEPATLATSANLAAIILSLNPRQSERIALALGAGLPVNPP